MDIYSNGNSCQCFCFCHNCIVCSSLGKKDTIKQVGWRH